MHGVLKTDHWIEGLRTQNFGTNIGQNQARDEKIFPVFFFKKIAMFLHIVQTNIQDINIFLINLMYSF
jgi:hypothetical protein